MASAEDLSDTAFIDRLEQAYDQNPLFRHKPENIARLYRLADMHQTADQFAAMIERISLPTIPWVVQQARAKLAGVDPSHYEAVMAERGMVLAFIRSLRQEIDSVPVRVELDDLIQTIERGEHRQFRAPPMPGQLVEEKDV